MDFVLYMFHWIIWKLRLMFVGRPHKNIHSPKKQISHPVLEKNVKDEKIEEIKVMVCDQY